MTSTPSEQHGPGEERLDELEEEIQEVRERLRKEQHEGERHFIDDGPTEHNVDDNIAPPG